MLAKPTHILSQLLPKTGQTVSYNDYNDDGNQQVGWWRKTKSTFDNFRQRFVSKTIGGDQVVIDRATGLMWAADGEAAGCKDGDDCYWADALYYAYYLTFAGFSDWRVPNLLELISIVNYGKTDGMDYYPRFFNTYGGWYWTSTTCPVSTDLQYAIYFNIGEVLGRIGDENTAYVRLVRGGK
jgi:hypothetical protein